MSSDKNYEPTKLLIRADLKRDMGYRDADTKVNMSVQVNEALDLVYNTGVRIPIIGRVAGGPSIIAEEHIEDYMILPERVAGGARFALSVKGDSMVPTLEPDDLVLVRAQTEASNNQIVVAAFDEDRTEREGSVKRLRYPAPGSAELRSDNEEYEPIIGGFSIVGIVVALLRRV